jgi:hypothetical protein
MWLLLSTPFVLTPPSSCRLKIAVSWDVAPSEFTDVTEVRTASIIRVTIITFIFVVVRTWNVTSWRFFRRCTNSVHDTALYSLRTNQILRTIVGLIIFIEIIHLPISSFLSLIVLVIEAAYTSETSVDIELRTWQYIPEDSQLHTAYRLYLLTKHPSYLKKSPPFLNICRHMQKKSKWNEGSSCGCQAV